MIDTTQTNYILADTRLEITNTNPEPGLLGISKDTSSLFVSDGNRWIETNINSKHNMEHQVTASDSINQSPLIHIDTSNNSTVENFNGNQAQDGNSVKRINSIVSNEALLTEPHLAGIYVDNDSNGNSGVKFHGVQGMNPDLDLSQKRDGEMTILCVYTPTPDVAGPGEGLERPWSPPNDVDPEDTATMGSNRYCIPKIGNQSIFSTFTMNSESNCANHYVRQHYSNNTSYFYGFDDQGNSYAGPQSYMTSSSDTNVSSGNTSGESFLVPGVTRADNGLTGNMYHHWNQNYVGKPQIVSYRAESNKESSTPGMLKTALHTWHPKYFDTNVNFQIQSLSYQKYSSLLYHGLSLGAVGSTYGHNTFYTHNTYHEIMLFDKYLTDKDLDIIGTHLASKWDTGGATDTWRL